MLSSPIKPKIPRMSLSMNRLTEKLASYRNPEAAIKEVKQEDDDPTKVKDEKGAQQKWKNRHTIRLY